MLHNAWVPQRLQQELPSRPRQIGTIESWHRPSMGVNDTHSWISWIVQRGRSGQSGLRHGSTSHLKPAPSSYS